MKKTSEVITGTTSRLRPVRVKLQRVDASLSKAYPPDGQGKIWWARLKQALGTSSSDFVNASLFQLQKAAQLPCGGISEIAINAALAMIEAAEPQNEIEGALAVQMACTHTAAISILARFGGSGGSERRVAALASAASRLLRAYSGQVETLRRLHHGSDQHVRLNMSTSMRGDKPSSEISARKAASVRSWWETGRSAMMKKAPNALSLATWR
jgi:hypothetical protein